MNRISTYLFIAFFLLCGVVYLQYKKTVRLTEERDRFQNNNTALLSDMKRMQIDSTTMAVDTKGLRLTIDEYKRFRAEDAAMIKKLGIKIKNLTAAAKHEVEVQIPISATIKDTLILRDTLPVLKQAVEMLNPHIRLTGWIENSRLEGQIYVPVTLQQALWIEYKRHWIFWKKVHAIHQIISSDNPYVEVKYSEFIKIEK